MGSNSIAFSKASFLVLGLTTGWVSALVAQNATAACSGLISGAVSVDVLSCQAVAPETQFPYADDRYQWIADLDKANRAKFLNSYRGLLLDAQVVNSQANRGSVSTDRGALLGDKIKIFVPPGQSNCAAVKGKRVNGALKEICCDGGGLPPCLLDTGFTLLTPIVGGVAGADNGKQARGQKAKNSADYKAAEIAIRAGKTKDAIRLLEAAQLKNELDVRGKFILAVSYRKADRCKDGIKLMQTLFEMNDSAELWEEERTMVRKATFLYARCLAKLNKSAESVLVLNGYLIEPTRFRDELNSSLKNPDFGYISSSKDYRDYRKLAEKKLRESASSAPTP